MRRNKFIYDSDLYRQSQCNPIGIGILVAAAIGIGILTFRSCHIPEPAHALATHTTQASTNDLQYIAFFRQHGSPEPQRMAQAVLATKRPRVMAAIAVVESNGDPYAIGDNGRARGAFQVWSHWGRVPHPDYPALQALQSERILEELIGDEPRRSLLRALSAYNTGRYDSRVGLRYARRVIKLTKELRA